MRKKHLKIGLVATAIALALLGGIMIPAQLHSPQRVDVSAEENNRLSSVNEPVSSKSCSEEQTCFEISPQQENREIMEQASDLAAPVEEAPSTPHTNSEDYDWIEARIQEHRHEIHDDDLEDFRIIIGKLDMGHIKAIVNGEIPGDMDQSLREYLLCQLDGREYERSKTLFLLYNHLMYEE